jgi:hypothetical protein
VIGPSRINAAISGRGAPPAAKPDAEPDAAETRALVPVEPVTDAQLVHHEIRRPSAAFVAHLIATASQAPQTREHRRGTPKDAIQRYGAAGKTAAARPTYSRST